MKQIIQQEYSDNQSYFYFGIFITVLVFLPQFYFSPGISHSISLFMLLIVLIAISKVSKFLFALVVVLLNISNLLIGHIAFHWGYADADITPRLEVALLSPVYETREYLQHYVDYHDYALFGYSLIIFFLVYRFIRHFSHSFKIFKIVGVLIVLLILGMMNDEINIFKELEPISVPCKVCSAVEDKQKIESLLQERQKYIQLLKLPISSKRHQLYDKIVIVLGESANKNHLSAYGYPIATTPFLSALSRQSGFYRFNAVAPTNQTRYSIPIDLTDATVHDYEHRYLRSCSIVTHFKSNGYATYWISNQGKVGRYDSAVSSIANEANTTYFANLNYEEAKTDRILIEHLSRMSPVPKKSMYVIHLIGSHADYINRYEHDKVLYPRPKTRIEDYDNTIYYTDSIMRQIFDRFKGEKLLFIYLSDHSENVNLENNGHGFSPSFRDEYQVPFIAYSTIPNRRLDELLSDNKKGVFNLENFDHMVRYISGISQQKHWSYSTDVMEVEPKNIVNYRELKEFT